MTWVFPALLWVVGPLIGFLVGLGSDFGSTIHRPMFEVCALIEPLMALALFVELAVVLGPVVERQGPTPANRDLTRTVVRANTGLALVAEAAALYALATVAASTMLLFAVTVPMVLQLLLITECAYHRVGISRIRRG